MLSPRPTAPVSYTHLDVYKRQAFAVPAGKGVAAPGGDILGPVNVGIVRSPPAGNITVAACFKAQRIVGDVRIVAAADVRPVGSGH